ncbi:membrane protein insertion efficiency factor YidD [Dactylosporangium sp. NPDC050588]|uniref:membrane protein insertion efficiency factor YidD n=1 Tax=Dactylosporangium sp. NPDC050588 TaxID=3157211 RepID=UPI0033DF2403
MARIGIGDAVAIWRHRRDRRRRQQQQHNQHQQNQQQRRRNRDSGDGCDCDACDCNPFMLGSLLGLMAIAAPRRAPRRTTTGPGRAGVAAIRGYQRWLSPHLPTHCRHFPTCSDYGLQAVRRYGLVEGSRLTAARIRRCNPSTPHGTKDPVP